MKVYSLRLITIDHFVYEELINVFSDYNKALEVANKIYPQIRKDEEIDEDEDGVNYLLITTHEI